MSALFCRSAAASCDLYLSRPLSASSLSTSSRRLATTRRGLSLSIRSSKNNACFSTSHTLAARSSSFGVFADCTSKSVTKSPRNGLLHTGDLLRPIVSLSHIRPYSEGPDRPTKQPDGKTNTTDTEQQSSSSPQKQHQQPPTTKTPLKATLETARERTKSATSALRSTLARSTRPKNENIYNIPNFLTATRLVAAPATAYLLLHDQHTAALLLFAYAGITDLVDGYLARKWNLQTVAGSVMDPMADKALMIIMTATLGIKGLIPASLAALILGRDASLAIAALYYRYASLPAPKTFMRYWDFSLPSAEVHPTTVSKYNTFLQLLLLGSALALPVLTADSHHLPLLHDLGIGGLDVHGAKRYFEYVVAATTVWSGLSYAFLKNAVTILGDDAALKAKQGARGRAIIGVTFGSVLLVASYLAVAVDEKREDEKVIVEKMTKA